MTLESDIALFRSIPLFADLPTEPLRLIAFSAVRLELAEKQVLFREGTRALSGYVVVSGGLTLSNGESARHRAEVRCEVGSLIGELALFIDTKRPATAVAAMPSHVLEIERKAMLRMLNEYPDAAVAMRARLVERLSVTVVDLWRVREALADPRERRQAGTG
jgi:CRP-like cAMP-binding protein